MKSLIHRGPVSASAGKRLQLEFDASFVAGVSAFGLTGEPLRTGLVGEEVAHRVRDELEAQLTGRIRQLKVGVAENSVVLSGFCSSFYTKQLAQHTARSVLSSERLVNDIAVHPCK